MKSIFLFSGKFPIYLLNLSPITLGYFSAASVALHLPHHSDPQRIPAAPISAYIALDVKSSNNYMIYQRVIND